MSKPDSYTQLLDGMACEQQYQLHQQKVDQASKMPDDFERIKAQSSLSEQWVNSGCSGKDKPIGTSTVKVISSQQLHKNIDQQWWNNEVFTISAVLVVGIIAGSLVTAVWKKRQ